MGDPDKLDGFARLERFVRAIEERCSPEADFAATVSHEWAISKQLGRRSVFDDRGKKSKGPENRQLSLF
jgi:hypothetical protein